MREGTHVHGREFCEAAFTLKPFHPALVSVLLCKAPGSGQPRWHRPVLLRHSWKKGLRALLSLPACNSRASSFQRVFYVPFMNLEACGSLTHLFMLRAIL